VLFLQRLELVRSVPIDRGSPGLLPDNADALTFAQSAMRAGMGYGENVRRF